MTGHFEIERPWHALSARETLSGLNANEDGLDTDEVVRRLAIFGRNVLPRRRRTPFAVLWLRQFKSPLIYLLLAAVGFSIAIGDFEDAAFILAVLFINASIGAVQEWKAAESASALDALVPERVVVRRSGRRGVIASAELVPGDIVEFESGAHVPADVRLLASQELTADESLLTGESTPVAKDAETVLDVSAALADRSNLLHAGSTVLQGRASGIVVRTGTRSEVGHIAAALAEGPRPSPPLMRRLERLSRAIGVVIMAAVIVLAIAHYARGVDLSQIFFLAVALAVSAIPEGLPVAITVALAVTTNRMARRNVIVRQLPAVEGLGACTVIASDKTGTLTRNELTVALLFVPGLGEVTIEGEGYQPVGRAMAGGVPLADAGAEIGAKTRELAAAGAMCNEASFYAAGGGFVRVGDTVDVALLVLAAKLGLDLDHLRAHQPRIALIPFEPGRRFSAAFHQSGGECRVYVKGAAETVAGMCAGADAAAALAEAERLAEAGYRVLAAASGTVSREAADEKSAAALTGLQFLGLFAIIDPVRAEVPSAVRHCAEAGIGVRMVTGDHPATALNIARTLGIARRSDEVVTGRELAALANRPEEFDLRVQSARVFARVEPAQKLSIVQSLQRAHHVVAVTGDGVNDAPALAAADLGIAMGRDGTDVARSAADLILADDNFASIIAGVEEGRIAYDNIRKVVSLLLSTGAAEVVIFFLCLLAGQPIPLFAVQLLWLNLVTNGIQDVALAFEKGEPDVLRRSPRPPREPIVNGRMISEVIVSGAFMGLVAFLYFWWSLSQGSGEVHARNELLLLMVLFENAHVFNCRSETRSILRTPMAANWFLVLAVIGAQAVHVGAMFVPGLSAILEIEPVPLQRWLSIAAIAASLVLIMEIYKWLTSMAGRRAAARG